MQLLGILQPGLRILRLVHTFFKSENIVVIDCKGQLEGIQRQIGTEAALNTGL